MGEGGRTDRLDRFYKSIFRIVGAVLLVGGLWMFGHYAASTGDEPGSAVAGSTSYDATIRQARADERRLGSILGATGALIGVATLVTAELVSRIAGRASTKLQDAS